ncbi:hypothetical protein RhiirA4_486573 [Rhizophagus irregularis]|uniref:RRM domain-containing protein n=1 Tax=Rhizophagus irregularis TaxID=588596 RepID=A0A2I1HRH8_9GLOM|nr:hypothetical protein RhiirA4_486573 [Rhizophagus irregularis]
MSYEVYREEMKRLSREEAQQQNREISHDVIKKVKEAKKREQIILEKNEKIRKVSQEVESTRLELKKAKSGAKNYNKRKGANRQKGVTKIPVDQLPIEKIDTLLYKETVIEILVYDIPARWKEDQIIKVFKNLGLVRKISIKNQFKYKSAKILMHLKLEQDKAEWRSRHSINLMMDDKMYWFCWFSSASMKLSEIRDRFKFVAYKEIKEDLRTASNMDILEYYKDQGWFYAKIIFIKGKKFIYTYFANQNKLEKAVVNSLSTGLYDVWIIPQKKKNFNTFISSGSVNPNHVTENVDVETSSSKESNEGSSSALKYTEKDVKAIVSRAIEEQIKEKEMISTVGNL